MKNLFARLVLAATLGSLFPSSMSAQNLFEADLGSQHIYEFTTNGTQSTFASSLHNPQGLAFNSAGDLFEADATSGDINEFTTNGTQSPFATGLGKTRGLAFNSAGILFVADYVSNSIYEFTPSGAQSTFASGLNGPGGLAFNSVGDLFEADEGSGNIYKFTNGVAAQKGLFASGLNEPEGLAFDSAGDLFESDQGSGNIYEFTNGVASMQGTFATGLNVPTGLAFNSAGTLFVANQGTNYDIYEFTNGVATEKGTFATGLDAPTYLAFQPFTPAFSGLTASQSIAYGTPAITLAGTVSAPGPVYPARDETITVTINGNAQTTTINNATGGFSFSYNPSTIPIGEPYTITYAYGGDYWLLALGSNLVAATSASTTLSVHPLQQILLASDVYGTINEFTTNGTESTFASGLASEGPEGLAFNNAGDLFVADNGSGNIYEITPSGAQTIFASLYDPEGLAFNSAGDLFVSRNGNIYEFTPSGAQTLFAGGFNNPLGLAFDSAGDLFMADENAGNIYEFTNGVASKKGIFASGLEGPTGLAFDSAGDLFVTDYSGNIYEFTNGVASKIGTFASGLGVQGPEGLAFNNAGDLFVSDSYGSIYEFAPSGAQTTFASGVVADWVAFQPEAPAFSGLTANQSITYGAPAITLAGTVSAPGPTYPAKGETITVTINGNAQTTTTSNSTGGFSLSYTPYTIPASATPYTITYAYGGDNWLLALGSNLVAATAASTTLTVNKAAPSFSNLTANQTINYGAASITLAGKVSASGPLYPPSGETITVTIDGNAQTTAINDSTGDFSFSYNPSTLPASATPYAITYSYAGDANFNAAPNNTSTSLTVNKTSPSFSNLTASQTITYGAASITLAGKVSASGPAYPAEGETVTVTINGNAQATTIDDSTGDFSFNYNLALIPPSSDAYTITYSYAGDANFNAASNNTSATLSVTNPIQTLFESDETNAINEFTAYGTESAFVSNGLAFPQGMAFDSAGDLFVSDYLDGKIYEFTNGVASMKGIFASGLIHPQGLAFDSAGDLFVADFYSGTIYEFTNGVASMKGPFASGLSGPFGLAFDSAGDLFEADSGSNKIYEFTNGAASMKGTFATGLDGPAGLAFDSAGDLFEADYTGNKIHEFTNGVASKEGTFATGLDGPEGLAFNSAGDLFEADYTGNQIHEFNPSGAKTTFASGIRPDFLAFQPEAPVFSGLTASQSIGYGTTPITLAGKLSATSPSTVYPAPGETITVTINGNAQATTINDSTGDFSVSYNPSTIPAAGTPYTITYSYGGDNWLLALGSNLFAATAASTSLTVNKATPNVTTWPTATAITYGQTLASSILSGGVATPAGAFAFTSPSTAPSAGTASQSVTYTPNDTTDYNTVIGTVGVTVNKASPAFSNLTPSQTINYGAASITLAGKVSASGPLYPPSGETITVTINGNAQTTTINDSTGDFSFSYNPSTLPASGTPYAITYSYAGDADFNAAPNDTSTTLTVNKANSSVTTWPMATAIVYGQTLASSILSGGMATPAGNFAFTSPSTAPSLGTALQNVTYMPNNTADYNTAAGTVSVTVNKATPSFSQLTSQFIAYGAASITLAGKVSASGPVYPAEGETITATINGNAQATTIDDSTGDFSFSYNPSTIPASATPYTITYSYAGDANFNAASNNASTTLLVNPLQTLFESDNSGNINEFTAGGTQSSTFAYVYTPEGLVFDSAGDLFVADYSNGIIYEFTNGMASMKGIFASGLDGPEGLAFDSAGDLFEADLVSGNIYEFTNGVASMKGLFASGLNEPIGLAFDSAGDLFVANNYNDTIYEFTNGVASKKGIFSTDVFEPEGLAFNSAGNLFVANFDDGDIFEFAANGRVLAFFENIVDPYGLAFNSAGDLFAIDGYHGYIYEYTPNGAQTKFASGVAPHFLAFQPEAPAFSGLTASQSIGYGTTSITLAGRLSATSPSTTYPAKGETITVTINGNAQTTTINDSTGDFSFSYNLSTIPPSGTPYTITCSYAGDNWLLAFASNLIAATDTSTTLTVNPLAVVLTGTRGYDGTATAASGILSVSNKVGSDVVTVASGSATLAGAGVGTQAITSPGTLALGGANAVNYTLTGASGSVTISNPFNPFTVTSSSLDVSGTNFVLCWQSVPGVTYTILTNTSLAPPQTWAAAGSPITATGTNTCFTLPGGIVGKTNTFVVIKQ